MVFPTINLWSTLTLRWFFVLKNDGTQTSFKKKNAIHLDMNVGNSPNPWFSLVFFCSKGHCQKPEWLENSTTQEHQSTIPEHSTTKKNGS